MATEPKAAESTKQPAGTSLEELTTRLSTLQTELEGYKKKEADLAGRQSSLDKKEANLQKQEQLHEAVMKLSQKFDSLELLVAAASDEKSSARQDDDDEEEKPKSKRRSSYLEEVKARQDAAKRESPKSDPVAARKAAVLMEMLEDANLPTDVLNTMDFMPVRRAFEDGDYKVGLNKARELVTKLNKPAASPVDQEAEDEKRLLELAKKKGLLIEDKIKPSGTKGSYKPSLEELRAASPEAAEEKFASGEWVYR